MMTQVLVGGWKNCYMSNSSLMAIIQAHLGSREMDPLDFCQLGARP